MVERPHIGWWISIAIGMTLTTALAVSDGFYGAFPAWFRALLPQAVIQGIAVVAWALHLGEAIHAFRLAKRAGSHVDAMGWFWQTLALGYPSLKLVPRAP